MAVQESTNESDPPSPAPLNPDEHADPGAEASWFYAMPPVENAFSPEDIASRDSAIAEQHREAELAPAPAPKRPRPAAVRADTAPLFILGNALEPAGQLTACLIRHAHMAGTVQGRLLPLAQQLMRTTRQFYRTGLAQAGDDAMIRQIDASVFQRGIRKVFAEALAAHFPGDVDWIDNSPGLGAVQSALTMRLIWPKARFIFIATRMMESVAARTAEDPARTPIELVTIWTQEMQAWSEARDKLGKSAITIDQSELHREPGLAATTIAGLLGLDSATAAALAASLAHDGVPASAGMPHGDESAIKNLAEPMMAAFGYGWDTYFRE